MRNLSVIFRRYLPHRLLVAAVLLVWLAMGTGTAFGQANEPNQAQLLKKQYRALQQQQAALRAEQKQLLAEQSKLADEIEQLKASDPGFIGRMRLERLLARNLEVSKRLDELATQLAENERNRRRIKEGVYAAYTAEMERVVRQMKSTTDQRYAADLARRFYELRTRREPWRSATSPESDYTLFEIDVASSGTPEELLANAQRLEDLVAKIREAIKRIEKNLNQLRRELRLNSEMRDMMRQNDLFQDGTRFYTGDRFAAQQTPEAPTPETDTGAVHRPPLPEARGEMPGGDRSSQSIQEEINRLEAERSYLVKTASRLSAKAAELRKKAKQQQRSERDPEWFALTAADREGR